MKHFFSLLFAFAVLSMNLKAQEETSHAISILTDSGTDLFKDTLKIKNDQDTTIVRIAGNDVKVITHDGGTEIILGKEKSKKHHSEKFKGHWQGLDLGFNGYNNSDYSRYDPSYGEFMSVIQEKSYEVGLNLFELNIGLHQPNIGLVTGLGFAFNDYKFENKYTIYRDVDQTMPVPIEYDDLKKTKLSVQYLNVPLLLEFQIPVNQNEGRIYFNAGILGAVKIGSHTKVKHGDSKDKDHDGFNINSFKYDATARIGYKGFGLYAKYSLTPLFQAGEGPELTPFTIGVSFGD
jgi:hypothetical protein